MELDSVCTPPRVKFIFKIGLLCPAFLLSFSFLSFFRSSSFSFFFVVLLLLLILLIFSFFFFFFSLLFGLLIFQVLTDNTNKEN